MDILKPLILLRDMIYPNTCCICNTWLVHTEVELCVLCFDNLPRAHYGIKNTNPVERIFRGRIPLSFAGAFLQFQEQSIGRELLHMIKYQGAKDLAEHLGFLYGIELKETSSEKVADVLLPVPLHPRKESIRGFNQSEYICRGLARALNCEVDSSILFRKKYTGSQTKKNRYSRWLNVDGVFAIRNTDKIHNRRVIVVDDVVTTGATIEACVGLILENSKCETGVLTLAHART
jgi:ComF family protein